MADFTIGTIVPKRINASTDIQFVKFGEDSCSVGKLVYRDLTDSLRRYFLAINDDTEAKAELAGIVLIGGDEDEFGLIAKGGEWDLAASIPEGASAVLSNTAGGLGPNTDLATGEYISILGTQGKDSFLIDINNTGETAS